MATALQSSRLRTIGLAALLTMVVATAPGGSRAQDAPVRQNPHGSWKADCSLCHSEEHWLPAAPTKKFDHSKYYPLQGAHRAVPCRSCHVSLVFSRAGKSCVDCHQDVHRGEMGTDCARCHTPLSFIDRSEAVRMHRTSRFPLSGAHAAADCESCHRTRSLGRTMYVGLPVECAGCHDSAAFPTAPQRPPDHVPAGFTGDCSVCHSSVTFGTARGGHATNGFPLTGGHAIACVRCHGQPFNSHLSPACISCHLAQYNATTDPNHVQAGFPTDCSLCHNNVSFIPATFNHSTTAFPLTGAHVGLDCVACHGDGVYRGKPTTCVSCHLAQYNGTTDPNHAQGGFPTDCTVCHTTATWSNSTFSHSTTAFPLTGAHAGLDCNACHADGVYRGKPTTCVSCHLAQYNGTTDPNHAQAGFPTDCTLCHTTVTWSGATFDHANTAFPLTGAHVGLACAACHADGVYAGKPTTCVSCHQAAYNAQTDPNHVSAGFSTDCTQCHTTATFTGARFTQHDASLPSSFPIYTGTHAGRWTHCSDCHTNSANYAVFSCFLCHSQAEMNSQHTGVSGYLYDSAACYHCHPNGSSNRTRSRR